jgi:hypothetical protein
MCSLAVICNFHALSYVLSATPKHGGQYLHKVVVTAMAN